MKESAGEANLTIIVIVLLGIIASFGIVFIPRLANNILYTSCCTEAGGIWDKGYCKASQPTTCENRENVFLQYDQCVIEHGKHNANEKYRAVQCN